jgi:glycosyltransferase involved in cell wall biosynthesis
MACGLALVSTPVGGIPDILVDGENGVLLASAKPDQIYDALRYLMTSKDVLQEISARNREIAWKRYEASVVTADIERYYQQVQSA